MLSVRRMLEQRSDMTAAALVCLEPEIGSHGDVTSPLRYSIDRDSGCEPWPNLRAMFEFKGETDVCQFAFKSSATRRMALPAITLV